MLSKCVVVIGYLSLSLSTVALLTAFSGIYTLNDYIISTYAPDSSEKFVYYKTAGLIFLSSFAALNLFNIITSVCLIFGALQTKKLCLLPYLVLTAIYIILYTSLSTWFFMKANEHSLRNSIVTVIFLVINIYCLIMVNSLYSRLKLREENYPQFLRETNRAQHQQNYETTYVKIP